MQLNFKKYCMRIGTKAAIMLFVVAMVTITFVSVANGSPDIIPGDVNQDGKVDVRDVVLIVKHIIGIQDLNEEQLKAADISGDGSVHVQDVNLIMQNVLRVEYLSRTVSSIETLAIDVSVNTAAESIPFPETVEATLSDDSVKKVKVKWEESSSPDYAMEEAGEYLFEGELVDLPSDISNTEGLRAQATVNVVAQDTSSSEPDRYSLALLVEPAVAGTASGDGEYEQNEIVQVSVKDINSAYEFTGWTSGGNVISNEVSFVFEMPAENTTLTANFRFIDSETFDEIGGEISQVIAGVYNVFIPYNIADSVFSGITQNSTITLIIAGKDPLALEYNDARDAFFKPAVQGYSENEIENSQVTAE